MPIDRSGYPYLQQRISSSLALIFIMILSTMVAWMTVVKAQEIIKSAKESTSLNVENRVQFKELK